jgi:hypothetical protein
MFLPSPNWCIDASPQVRACAWHLRRWRPSRSIWRALGSRTLLVPLSSPPPQFSGAIPTGRPPPEPPRREQARIPPSRRLHARHAPPPQIRSSRAHAPLRSPLYRSLQVGRSRRGHPRDEREPESHPPDVTRATNPQFIGVFARAAMVGINIWWARHKRATAWKSLTQRELNAAHMGPEFVLEKVG